MTITRASSHGAPTSVGSGTSLARSCGTVTTGQLISVSLASYADTSPTIVAGSLTQTAGTATIGTVTLDRQDGGLATGGVYVNTTLWSFIVTAGGTLTVTVAGLPAASSLTISSAGYDSDIGWDSSRVEDDNGAFSATDGQSSHATGNGTSAGAALFVAVLGLNNGADISITEDAAFTLIGEELNGDTVECTSHIDRIVSSGTTDEGAWTYTALDGNAYNGQSASLVVYKEAAPTSSLEQEGFRFGNDDAAEASHTWAAAQDANITAPAGSPLLLAFNVNATGSPGAKTFKLQHRKAGDPDWIDTPIG